MFWSVLKNHLAYWNFNAIEFLRQFQNLYNVFQEDVNNFEIVHKTCPILVWGAVPP